MHASDSRKILSLGLESANPLEVSVNTVVTIVLSVLIYSDCLRVRCSLNGSGGNQPQDAWQQRRACIRAGAGAEQQGSGGELPALDGPSGLLVERPQTEAQRDEEGVQAGTQLSLSVSQAVVHLEEQ